MIKFAYFIGDNFDSCFYSFSFIKSIEELLKYDKKNKLNSTHGLKVITMLIVLFGHQYFYVAGSPYVNAIFAEDVSFQI